MKLPNLDNAIIDREKIVDYLLNAAHPDNGGKAEFFHSLGFDRDNWQEFTEALWRLSEKAEIAQIVESPHGAKYIINGELESPQGKRSMVRMIWIVDSGHDEPRLVTVYPQKG